jgi:hypothetical protein
VICVLYLGGQDRHITSKCDLKERTIEENVRILGWKALPGLAL